ncbi:hypothetical protein AU476_19950 [Cupriavidus sp. UYMSc13B]|nr:hypothetical protein AU476_34965 [Cupriavidus sp. UYMSc13B]RWA51901.1 hypothetical protein AU476_19950 [Cupriavidus sp. UYMSc13B]
MQAMPAGLMEFAKSALIFATCSKHQNQSRLALLRSNLSRHHLYAYHRNLLTRIRRAKSMATCL